jgi:alkylated DNA repair dioxygenase AlkB
MAGSLGPVERVQLDEHSWVDLHRGWLHDADGLYAELAETAPWQQGRLFKFDHWVEEPRLGCWQRPDGAHPALREAQRRIQEEYKVLFDGFSLAWYRDGRDSVAFHRDRDMKWLDETVIVLLTLGARRPWLVRPRSKKFTDEPGKGAVHDFAPASGDLLVMGGRTQVGWEHSVPKVPGLRTGRISAQWRWTSRRGRQEIGGSYRKPVTYSR